MKERLFFGVRFGLLVLLAGGLCLPAQMGAAQPNFDGTTITVNSLGDDLTVNGNCTLREAVQAANTDTAVDACQAGNGADMILLPAGTITMALVEEPETNFGSEDDENVLGDFDVAEDVTITGAGKLVTTLTGDGSSRAFEVFSSVTLTLRDFTLQSVSFSSPYSEPEFGAIQNKGVLVMERIWVDDCSSPNESMSADGEAGAIHNFGSLTIRDSEFTGNFGGYDSEGGAIASQNGVLVIEDSLFENNFSYYGAIDASGQITIRRSIFRNNFAGREGNDALAFSGDTVLVEDSRFEGNSSGADGPGITFRGAVTIRNTEFVDNDPVQVHDNTLLENVFFDETGLDGRTASLTIVSSTLRNAGGSKIYRRIEDDYWVGVLRVGEGVARIENSTVTANTGAVEVVGGELTVVNSTFSGNELDADPWYEAEVSWDSLIMVTGGELVIENSTITNNHGDYALHVKSGSASLRNTILNATHWPGEPNHADCLKDAGATLTSLGYNIISISSGCGWVSSGCDQLGTLADPLNPGLFGLADNGGPTLTHALREGSIALDTGHPSLFPPTDQRGQARPADGDGNGVARVDIGAFEAATVPPKLDQLVFLPQLGR